MIRHHRGLVHGCAASQEHALRIFSESPFLYVHEFPLRFLETLPGFPNGPHPTAIFLLISPGNRGTYS
jgi:hypothetical protein